MKLPTAVVTKHKIRDSKILSLYSTDAWSYEEIATRFGISATRVGQIIYKNKALLVLDREHEKIKRVNTLKRLLKKHPNNIGNKTTIDITEALRNEAEGKSGSEPVGRSDTRIIIIRAEKDQSVQVSDNIAGMSIIRPAVAQAVEANNAQDNSASVPG